MADNPSRFTSDRRTPIHASWSGSDDWSVGAMDGVDVVGESLLGRSPTPVRVFESAVHHWRIDSGLGSTASDSIGQADIELDGPSWISDSSLVGGYGLDFQPAESGAIRSDFVDVGDSGTLLLTARPREASSQQFLFEHGHWEAKNRLRIQIESNGTWGYSLAADGGVSVGVPVSFNTLSRIGLRWDSGSFWYYIDGTQVDSGSYSGTLSSTISKGQWNVGSSSYDGIIDNIIMCDDPVSDSQISKDYTRQPWV